MKRVLAFAAAALAAIGCGGAPAPAPEAPTSPKPLRPESDRITVAHVLISFAGVPKVKARRSKEEAEKLANEVLRKAARGEDFDKLMKDYSDDTGEGVYLLLNRKVRKMGEEEIPRENMVQSFGDIGFQLDVGGIGMAVYDSSKSPYGWHIIKRLK